MITSLHLSASTGGNGRHRKSGIKSRAVMSDKVKSIYRGKIVALGLETASMPDGRETDLEIVRHPGGVVIVALDAQQRVCMLRQFRYAVGGWIWELPAGILEAGERPEISARRELKEESGAQANTWVTLGTAVSSPGFCDERLHLFLARDLRLGATAHEENEFIEVHWLPLDQVVAMALDDEINDAKSVIGLLRAQAILKA